MPSLSYLPYSRFLCWKLETAKIWIISRKCISKCVMSVLSCTRWTSWRGLHSYRKMITFWFWATSWPSLHFWNLHDIFASIAEEVTSSSNWRRRERWRIIVTMITVVGRCLNTGPAGCTLYGMEEHVRECPSMMTPTCCQARVGHSLTCQLPRLPVSPAACPLICLWLCLAGRRVGNPSTSSRRGVRGRRPACLWAREVGMQLPLLPLSSGTTANANGSCSSELNKENVSQLPSGQSN